MMHATIHTIEIVAIVFLGLIVWNFNDRINTIATWSNDVDRWLRNDDPSAENTIDNEQPSLR